MYWLLTVNTAGRVQWRRCGSILSGRRRFGMSAGYQAVVETVRREEQSDGRCAMSGRSKSCERRSDTHFYAMVEHGTEQQIYVEDRASML